MKIELRDIHKTYGKQEVLKGVSVTMENGVYGLLGKNGAGKTTLINIFLGLLKADSGQVIIDGREAAGMGSRFYGDIGYLPQYPRFYKEFSVQEFMEYMCVLKGVPAGEGKARVRELLEKVNLSGSVKKKIGALSGGMRQRLGIAQAMVNFPKVLILDEPTSGLDPQERIRFRNLISEFAEGRIVLLVTHIVPDVEYIASQVIIMDQGEIVHKGRIEELEGTLEGKVWQVTTREEKKFLGAEGTIISNIRREGREVEIRMIADKKPDPDAISVRANLDEVFLCSCMGEELCGN